MSRAFHHTPLALIGFGRTVTGNQQFKGNGRMRSCARCGQRRPEFTGGWHTFLGRKQWHCAEHLPMTREQAIAEIRRLMEQHGITVDELQQDQQRGGQQ